MDFSRILVIWVGIWWFSGLILVLAQFFLFGLINIYIDLNTPPFLHRQANNKSRTNQVNAQNWIFFIFFIIPFIQMEMLLVCWTISLSDIYELLLTNQLYHYLPTELPTIFQLFEIISSFHQLIAAIWKLNKTIEIKCINKY